MKYCFFLLLILNCNMAISQVKTPVEIKNAGDSIYKLIEKPFENLRSAYRRQVVLYKNILDKIHSDKAVELNKELEPLLMVNITPATTFDYDEKEYSMIKQVDSFIFKKRLKEKMLLSIEASKNRIGVAVFDYNKAVREYNLTAASKLKPLDRREGYQSKIDF